MSSTLQPRGRLEKNLSREQSDDESTTFISLSVIDGSSNDITNSPKRETNLLLDGTESYETSDTSEYEKNVNFQASEYDIDEEELCFLYSASRSLSEKNLESPPSYPTVDGYKLRKKKIQSRINVSFDHAKRFVKVSFRFKLRSLTSCFYFSLINYSDVACHLIIIRSSRQHDSHSTLDF
uniref:Uncharacterized protein n=1 Tax=Corethron hystrix TaxID=216773 RepID=A0A7S1G2A3_9STRA|mmetsp:Transcript_7961/g.17276  ORF Transcript_7961/g.17276 Transcript_7961/m.17276 type:complete len:180 (+) Transcript_7961:157-696(+)